MDAVTNNPKVDRRFVVLDSWRGIAALFVAVHNFGYPPGSFVEHSSFFVDFFFVLSGFVISHAYIERLKDSKALAVFVMRRAGRLLPLHVTMLCVFVALDVVKLRMGEVPGGAFATRPFSPPNSIQAIWQNLFLVQAIGRDTEISWNAPSWSISVEFWTYILFGAAVVCQHGRPIRRCWVAAIAAASAGAIILLCPGYLVSNTEFPLLRCLLSFSIGHLIWRAWHEDLRPMVTGPSFEVPAVVLALIFVVVAHGIWSMAAPLIFGYAVWVFAYGDGGVSKLLARRPFAQLGAWSYSIYMVQWLVRNVMSRLAKGMGLAFSVNHGAGTPWQGAGYHWQVDLLLVVYLVGVISLAALTYCWIEVPTRRCVHRL